MEDKGLNIFLMLLFGMGGIVILIIAWIRPMPVPERILATAVGSIGLLGVLIRAQLLRSAVAKTSIGENRAEAEIKYKPC